MEQVRCPITGSRETEAVIHVPDRLNDSHEACWTVARSSSSGLMFLSPRPEQDKIGAYYHEKEYEPHSSLRQTSGFRNALYRLARRAALSWKARLILAAADALPSHPSILEIGCATGELLQELQRRTGARVYGSETDSKAAAYACKRFGLQVVTTSLEKSSIEGPFDLIVLWHSLEHMHHIGEVLHKISCLLAPEGSIVAALPNPSGNDAKLFGENWVGWDAPRHLYHFTPGTLAALAAQYGLSITAMNSYPPDALYHAWHSTALKLRRREKHPGVRSAIGAAWQGFGVMLSGLRKTEQGSSIVYVIRHARHSSVHTTVP